MIVNKFHSRAVSCFFYGLSGAGDRPEQRVYARISGLRNGDLKPPFLPFPVTRASLAGAACRIDR
jgi:hypothetical protein